MQDGVNHYDFLGLSPTAPDQLVEAAVWRLVDRATALAHTSPQRSDELWERIRLVRKDLLAGEETRRAYNAALVKAQDAATSAQTNDKDGLAATGIERIRTVRRPSTERRRKQGIIQYSLDGLVGVTVMVVIAMLFLHPWSGPSGGAHAALALSSDGPRQGSAFKSGVQITLRWSRVPKAVVYRLQVATAPVIERPAIPLSQPEYSGLTTSNSHRITVVGAQFYYWRVRVNVGGAWLPYSSAHLFVVARPSVASPVPLLPRNGSVLRPGTTRLCWSGVKGASAYELFLSGPALRAASSCHNVRLKAGRYGWEVLSLVRGVQTYRGPRSVVAHFIVRAPKKHIRTRGKSSAQGSAGAASGSVISSTTVIPAVVVSPPPVQRTVAQTQPAVTRATPPPPPPIPSLRGTHVRFHSALRSTPSASRRTPPPPPPVP